MRICTIPDCNNKHSGKGYCAKHYALWYRTGDATKRTRVWSYNGADCSLDNCNNVAVAKGYCDKHYSRYKRHKNPETVLKTEFCSVDGCGRKHCGLGYCTMHLSRYHSNGDANIVQIRKSKRGTVRCSVKGCSNKNQSKGLCNAHYQRSLRYDGNPLGKSFNTERKETLLYKFFNSKNEIIYIGITCDYKARMRNHSNTQFWWDEVVSIKKKKYPNRTKAIEAEKRAINKYNPTYNIIHNKKAA